MVFGGSRWWFVSLLSGVAATATVWCTFFLLLHPYLIMNELDSSCLSLPAPTKLMVRMAFAVVQLRIRERSTPAQCGSFPRRASPDQQEEPPSLPSVSFCSSLLGCSITAKRTVLGLVVVPSQGHYSGFLESLKKAGELLLASTSAEEFDSSLFVFSELVVQAARIREEEPTLPRKKLQEVLNQFSSSALKHIMSWRWEKSGSRMFDPRSCLGNIIAALPISFNQLRGPSLLMAMTVALDTIVMIQQHKTATSPLDQQQENLCFILEIAERMLTSLEICSIPVQLYASNSHFFSLTSFDLQKIAPS